MAILLLLSCCLLLPRPSIPGLHRVLRLFWDSGEAQMYSKDSIKGQGHPGHPLPSRRPLFSPPPFPQLTLASGDLLSHESIMAAKELHRGRAVDLLGGISSL